MMRWTKEKRRKYSKERRYKRRKEHLCLSCDTKTNGKAYCIQCTIKRSRQQQLVSNERKNKGLCIQCGRISKHGRSRCSRCSEPTKAPRKRRRDALVKQGLCYSCGAQTSGKKACEFCLTQRKYLEKQRRKSLKEAGLCCQCGLFPPLCGVTRYKNLHTLCRMCHLKCISRVNLRSSKYANVLLAKLEAQNYKCPYTGNDLVLGDNAWIDHIMPRSRFPELIKDIDNIEWVTEDVNRMKQNKTPDEFLSLIKQIHDYRSL